MVHIQTAQPAISCLCTITSGMMTLVFCTIMLGNYSTNLKLLLTYHSFLHTITHRQNDLVYMQLRFGIETCCFL